MYYTYYILHILHIIKTNIYDIANGAAMV